MAAGGSGGTGEEDGAPGGDINGRYKSGKGQIGISNKTTQNLGPENCQGAEGEESLNVPGSGGGGGYRGGVSSNKTSGYLNVNPFEKPYGWVDNFYSVAHSGSSYITNHPGCSITQNVKFTNTKMDVGYKSNDGLVTIESVYVCSATCGSCNSENTCYSCFNNNKLYKNKCFSECPDMN